MFVGYHNAVCSVGFPRTVAMFSFVLVSLFVCIMLFATTLPVLAQSAHNHSHHNHASVTAADEQVQQAYQQLQQSAPELIRESQAITYRSARERLRLLGLHGKQIDEIIHSGRVSDRVTIYAPSAGVVISRMAI